MEIIVSRVVSDGEATIGILYLDGGFNCFTLEDIRRETKVPGKTRIPAGKYALGVKCHGRLHEKYLKRYGTMHKGMLHVQGVAGFTDILIHTGNTAKDTSGCLLVGESYTRPGGKPMITSSRNAYKKLYPLLIDAAIAGDLEIEYRDDDGRNK